MNVYRMTVQIVNLATYFSNTLQSMKNQDEVLVIYHLDMVVEHF